MEIKSSGSFVAFVTRSVGLQEPHIYFFWPRKINTTLEKNDFVGG